MYYLALILTALAAYFLCSINTAIIVSYFIDKKDIREQGSKNAGMTNVLRIYGKKAAAFTVVGDFSKGVLAVVIASLLCILFGHNNGPDRLFACHIAMLFGVLGHAYPIYYKFKGGKGILISIGALLFFDPFVGLSLLALFAVLVAITKIVSVGSIAAAASLPLMTFLIHRITNPQFYIRDTVVALIIGVFVVFMHRSNIVRLINGTENKFGKSKEK